MLLHYAAHLLGLAQLAVAIYLLSTGEYVAGLGNVFGGLGLMLVRWLCAVTATQCQRQDPVILRLRRPPPRPSDNYHDED